MNDILQAVVVRSVSGHRPLVDMEAGPAPDPFLSQIDELQGNIEEIERRQLELQRLHEAGKTLISNKEIERHRNAMQANVDDVNKLAHSVKAKLEALEQENESLRSSRAIGFADQDRRRALTAALRTKLKNQISAFSGIRTVIQDEYRQVVERRVYAVTGQRLSQEEIDQMIETGASETIFKKAILQQGRPAVLATLVEIEERHKAAKSLEQGLLELNQLFLEMAVLVEEQGQRLDDIELHVNRAKTFVNHGTKELVVAKNHWHRSNNLKWGLAAIIIAIIIVIALLILQPWAKKK